MRVRVWAGLLLGLAVVAPAAAWAEAIKIGVLKTSGSGPVYIAQDKGYFAAEGVPAQIVFFEAGAAIPSAVVSGDIDFGVTGINAGLYNLAAQNQLRVIAAQAREAPGFPNNTMVASNKAWDAGLKSFKDIGNRSMAIGAVGTPPHYSAVLIAEKYGIDFKSIRTQQLGAIPNVVNAMIGGQADIGVMPISYVQAAIQAGQVKLLGYIGDEVPYQFGGAFTSVKATDARHETVERFLRAYRKGTKEYHDAFTGNDGKLAFGPGSAAALDIIAKNIGQTVDQIKLGISFVDADARLDVKDIQHQIDWFKEAGMVKGDIDAAKAVDMRYAIALPDKK